MLAKNLGDQHPGNTVGGRQYPGFLGKLGQFNLATPRPSAVDPRHRGKGFVEQWLRNKDLPRRTAAAFARSRAQRCVCATGLAGGVDRTPPGAGRHPSRMRAYWSRNVAIGARRQSKTYRYDAISTVAFSAIMSTVDFEAARKHWRIWPPREQAQPLICRQLPMTFGGEPKLTGTMLLELPRAARHRPRQQGHGRRRGDL